MGKDMADDREVFGKQVKKHRDALGLSGTALGDIIFNKKTKDGVEGTDRKGDVSRLEKGKYDGVQNKKFVRRVVEALDIPIHDVPRSLLWDEANVRLSVNTAARLMSCDAGFVENPSQFSDHSRHYPKAHDRVFLKDVLNFVENGYYRESLDLVQASVNFILTCDDQGLRRATDDLCGFVLRDRNILDRDGIPAELMATVEHANERGCLTDEWEFCLSSDVSKDRVDAASVCLACSHLKHQRVREAEPIIHSLWEKRSSLSEKNRTRVFGLSGRLLLHRSKGSDRRMMLRARDRLAVAARDLPEGDMHIHHYEMLRAVASWLLTKSEAEARAIRAAAIRVTHGVGESCVVPSKVLHDLVVCG